MQVADDSLVANKEPEYYIHISLLINYALTLTIIKKAMIV